MATTPHLEDDHGVTHTCPPGESEGRGHYGVPGAGYACGCQPWIHRFKCITCRRLVGWCMGSDDSPDCDDCAVVRLRKHEDP
jgi:hypothetical protein